MNCKSLSYWSSLNSVLCLHMNIFDLQARAHCVWLPRAIFKATIYKAKSNKGINTELICVQLMACAYFLSPSKHLLIINLYRGSKMCIGNSWPGNTTELSVNMGMLRNS